MAESVLQSVYQNETERERLRVQSALLREAEAPCLAQLVKGKSGLFVLDIGCNDGEKTADRFSLPEVSCVLGVERDPVMAKKAQARYGSEKFSFYAFDAEGESSDCRFREAMERAGIDGFDIIYLSYVLMHLKNRERLLKSLLPYLKREGHLVMIEGNDNFSSLSPDPKGLLPEFLRLMAKDPYAGSRNVGEALPELLKKCGYGEIELYSRGLSAGETEAEKKRCLLRVFCSFLKEDAELLLQSEPENEDYRVLSDWMHQNYAQLEKAVLSPESRVRFGVTVLSCKREAGRE